MRDAAGAQISAVVTWSSSADAVATVNNQGRVTAVGNGTARIIAAAAAFQDTVDVTVQQVAATLTLAPDTLRLANAGDTMTVAATVKDAGGSLMSGVPVTFGSNNTGIATVNPSTGKVTAVADGATTITGQVAPGGGNLTKSVRVEVGGVLPPAYLVGGYIGTSYTDQLDPVSGSGGSFTYTVTDGALPTGLSLNASNRNITGTPTTSGAFFFQVTATNGTVTASERFAITISTKPVGAFNLWLTYGGGALPPANARIAISAALARMEEVITGDVGASITYPSSGLTPSTCSLVDASLMNGAFIEDVSILMEIGPIDGSGQTLARGGFCGYGRPGAPPATVTGQMLLDEVDAVNASSTFLQDVIWHEMGHVLGIGTLWQSMTTGTGTQTVLYNGTTGRAEWHTLGGVGDVPLQPDTGAHWNEGWFNSEVMTPVTEGSGVRLPISRMTIGALIDLGWGATLTAADAYTLPGCSPSCSIVAPAEGIASRAFVDDFVIEKMLPLPPESVNRDP